MNPELAAKVELWKQKAAVGELSLEEMKEAIKYLREGRVASLASSNVAKKRKAIAAIPTAEMADDMIKQMMGG